MSDTAIRLLRDGALEGESAPVLVVSDTVACNSGPRVFHQLVQSLARAVTSDHAQAKYVFAYPPQCLQDNYKQ